jgi:hypothetical protein
MRSGLVDITSNNTEAERLPMLLALVTALVAASVVAIAAITFLLMIAHL